MICRSCEKEAGQGPFCAACKAILPPDAATDRFAVLGLPRKFEVDLGAAEAAYKDLSRQFHPDRFAKADPRARKASLARTVQINDAWRTVKDPLRRAEYLLELAGYALAGGEKSPAMAATRKVSAPPTFLVEIMELRDELAEAQQGGDAVKVAFMADDIRGRAAAAMATIGAAIDTPGKLEEAARALMSLRYYQRFLDEVQAHEARTSGSAQVAEAFLQISEPGASAPKRACQTRAVGIDLGTTNSLVAIVDGGRPVCLRDENDQAILPSVVHYAGDGTIVVGAEAHDRLAPEFPRDTIASVKRFMGRGPRDAEATRKLTPYQFAPPAGDGGNVVRFAVAGGRAVTPMEVSAEILKALKRRAEGELGGSLDGAVITVPAYFDDGQRQATRDAGRLAGLEVLRLINEPTAAAIAYGLDKQAEGTFAVFDLGGGTFDVSILKLEDGVFEVKATGGDSALGGDDFDRAIAGALLEQWGLADAAAGDAKVIRRVLDAARVIKERLTSETEVTIEVALLDGNRTAHLTRTEMELLVEPVLMRCAAPVRRALEDATIEPAKLSGVILVGGATRMPLVRQFVEKLFGRAPLGDIDPDEVVALGAAVQAEVLAGGAGQGDMLLLDVVPLSLGLETMGGVVEKIIHRNTTVPCGATQTFTTFADKQTGFELQVVQGEREMVDDCRSLAKFTLKGIPPMPAGMARLEVTFMVDADGILHVTAREETTGQEAKIEVKPSYGLSDEEVERMLLDSFAHAEEDVQLRLLTEQQVEADRIAAAARAAMADTPDLLTPEDRVAIDAALAALAAARAGKDHHAIRAAVEALDQASKEFAARRMNVAFDRGLRGKDVAAVEAKADETIPKKRHGGHSH